MRRASEIDLLQKTTVLPSRFECAFKKMVHKQFFGKQMIDFLSLWHVRALDPAYNFYSIPQLKPHTVWNCINVSLSFHVGALCNPGLLHKFWCGIQVGRCSGK